MTGTSRNLLLLGLAGAALLYWYAHRTVPSTATLPGGELYSPYGAAGVQWGAPPSGGATGSGGGYAPQASQPPSDPSGQTAGAQVATSPTVGGRQIGVFYAPGVNPSVHVGPQVTHAGGVD